LFNGFVTHGAKRYTFDVQEVRAATFFCPTVAAPRFQQAQRRIRQDSETIQSAAESGGLSPWARGEAQSHSDAASFVGAAGFSSSVAFLGSARRGVLSVQGLSLELEKRQKFCRSHSSDENYPAPGRDCDWQFPLPAALRQQSPRLRSSEQTFPYRQERLV
jgi:hypothetical protein